MHYLLRSDSGDYLLLCHDDSRPIYKLGSAATRGIRRQAVADTVPDISADNIDRSKLSLTNTRIRVYGTLDAGCLSLIGMEKMRAIPTLEAANISNQQRDFSVAVLFRFDGTDLRTIDASLCAGKTFRAAFVRSFSDDTLQLYLKRVSHEGRLNYLVPMPAPSAMVKTRVCSGPRSLLPSRFAGIIESFTACKTNMGLNAHWVRNKGALGSGNWFLDVAAITKLIATMNIICPVWNIPAVCRPSRDVTVHNVLLAELWLEFSLKSSPSPTTKAQFSNLAELRYDPHAKEIEITLPHSRLHHSHFKCKCSNQIPESQHGQSSISWCSNKGVWGLRYNQGVPKTSLEASHLKTLLLFARAYSSEGRSPGPATVNDGGLTSGIEVPLFGSRNKGSMRNNGIKGIAEEGDAIRHNPPLAVFKCASTTPLHWNSQAVQKYKVQGVLRRNMQDTCDKKPDVCQEPCEGYFVGRFLSSNKGRAHKAPLCILYSLILAMVSLASFFGKANKATTLRGLGNTERRFTSRTNKASIGVRRRAQSQTSSTWSTSSSMFLLLSWTALVLLLGSEAADLRSNIINGAERCFHYTSEQELFYMNCSLVQWKAEGYGSDTYISLGANETFRGDIGVDSGKSIIDLTGILDFRGLFTIDGSVTTFNEAPSITNVHIRSGTIAAKGGFIVRARQRYFVVDLCSSTGDITGAQAGGICGAQCGRDNGEIRISSSYSTGKIIGTLAGGIAGGAVGIDGGLVHLDRCFSTGNIEGSWAGGICGDGAGRQNGRVYITKSFSTGNIVSKESGGIVGDTAGWDSGYVYIQECYSKGQILGDYSGGIAADGVASNNGEVHIIDCYTRGSIYGEFAGGITALNTGGSANQYGNVYIINTYASGAIVSGGGIIGHIDLNFNGYTIQVQYSVHNGGNTVSEDVGGHLIQTGNSAYLGDIQGKLYTQWDPNIWYACAAGELPILRFQLPSPSPTISPTATATPTMSATSSITATRTATTSRTATSTTSSTALPSSLRTTSSSSSPSIFTSPTPTLSPTPTTTTSVTQSKLATPTTSSTASPSASRTMTSAADLRSNIIKGTEPCFQYKAEEQLFRLSCSELNWLANGYGSNNYISLGANETFDGSSVNATLEATIIDLSGLIGFHGLFRIKASVTTFVDAPLIRNVHVRGGTIAESGGFIVQADQRYFTVDSCSSTGDITSNLAGGICGDRCGRDYGKIQVSNSYSTGGIGKYGGGITGGGVGYNGGIAQITQCQSTGNIQGRLAGGICGSSAGYTDGKVYITKSYSTGDILSNAGWSGGIAGANAAWKRGYLRIQECYSTGKISAYQSGGITGGDAGENSGDVRIIDCYTQGDISGQYAGGLTGYNTGGTHTKGFGSVCMRNTYASGTVKAGNDAGGLIGHINTDFTGYTIRVQYSVYNGGPLLGAGPASNLDQTGNTGNLMEIQGRLYDQWDDNVWTISDAYGQLPILRFQLPSPTPSPSFTSTSTSSISATASFSPSITTTQTNSRTATSTSLSTASSASLRTTSSSSSPSMSTSSTASRTMTAAADLRSNIIKGSEPCFQYAAEKQLFHMSCSELNWLANGYGSNNYISLGANETFDGNSGMDDGESTIDLSGIDGFQGLFTIDDSVATFDEAPLIRNVHVRNGTLADNAGFIIRHNQTNFALDSCSSTGDITNTGAGGICGSQCGSGGSEIRISRSYSTGRIMGMWGGGITGSQTGRNGGNVRITRCYSTGNIEASYAGGICGAAAGQYYGKVYITRSYSTGDILSGAQRSGGIVGQSAGRDNGYVNIQQCYSTGHISAEGSGGITGSYAADTEGEVHIVDCYTKGNINSFHAGGITGHRTGGCCSEASEYGDVYITNTYSSGTVNGIGVGAMVGHIHWNFQGHTIHIKYSVHNNKNSPKRVGEDSEGHLDETGNSDNLNELRGQLYHYGGVQRWNSHVWIVDDADDQLPTFRFQQATPSPSPSSTGTRTPSNSQTASIMIATTSTSTISRCTATTSATASITATRTATRTATNSSSSPSIATSSPRTAPTSMPSQSSASTSNSSRSSSPSATQTAIPSQSSAATVSSGSPSSTKTPAPTPSPSTTSTASCSITGSQSTTPLQSNTATFCASCSALTTQSVTGTSGAPSCAILSWNRNEISFKIDKVQAISVFGSSASQEFGVTASPSTISTFSVTVITYCSKEEPQFSVSCGELEFRKNNDTVFIGCLETYEYSMADLVHVESEILTNSTCVGDPKGDSCRESTYLVTLPLVTNFSDILRHQVLVALDRYNPTFVAPIKLTASVGSNSKSFVVPIYFNFSDSAVDILSQDQIGPSAVPSALSIKYSRDTSSSNLIVRSITILTRYYDRLKWSSSASLVGIVALPSPSIMSGKSIEETLVFDIGIMEAGKTEGAIIISLSNARRKKLHRVRIPVTIEVSQGDLQVESQSIHFQFSSTEKGGSKSIGLHNIGNHPIQISSMVTHPNGSEISPPWLTVATPPLIAETSKSPLSLSVEVEKLNMTGTIIVWIKIVSDAWLVRSLDFEDAIWEADSGPSIKPLTIRMQVTIASLFICPPMSQVATLRPGAIRHLHWGIMNTELSMVHVKLDEVSLLLRQQEPLPLYNKAIRNSISPVSILPNGLKNGIPLTPWLMVAPIEYSLPRGVSQDLVFRLKYLDRLLPINPRNGSTSIFLKPAKMRLRFSLSVSLSGRPSTAELFERSIDLSFAPGGASEQHSFLRLRRNAGSVGESLQGEIVLLDKFGYGPASVRYYSHYPSQGLDTQESRVVVELLSSHTFPPVILRTHHHLVEGVKISWLSFWLELRSMGEMVLDIKMNGVPLHDAPRNISSNAIRCNGSEVHDEAGTLCLCQGGYYRSPKDGGCMACRRGTYRPTASNLGFCLQCPQGYFSLDGESECHQCPGSGVKCHDGILTMLPGHWCSECSQRKLNHPHVIEEIISNEELPFYECRPAQACVVNGSAFTTSCLRGYTGVICSDCEEGYVRLLDGTCVECSNDERDTAIAVVLGVMLLLVLVGIALHSYRKSAWQKDSKRRYTFQLVSVTSDPNAKDKEHRSSSGNADKLDTSQLDMDQYEHRKLVENDYYKRNGHWESFRRLLLIFIDYLQISSTLQKMEINPFLGPLTWLRGASQTATMNPSNAAPIRCATKTSLFDVAIAVMFSPVAMAVVILTLHGVVEASLSGLKFRRQRWITDAAYSLILVLSLIHTAVTDVTFRSLEVYGEEVESSQRAKIDLTIKANSMTFRTLQAVGVVSLVSFVFALPLGVSAFLLWWHSKAKTVPLYKELLKFVGGFRLNNYGYVWESSVLIRKILLLVVAVFMEGPLNQMVSATLIFYVSFAALAVVKPYWDHHLNYLESLIIIVSAFNCYCGVLLFPFRDTRKILVSAPHPVIESILVLLQVGLLLVFSVKGFTLVPGAVEKLKRVLATKVNPMIQKIKDKCCKKNGTPKSKNKKTRDSKTDEVSVDLKNPLVAAFKESKTKKPRLPSITQSVSAPKRPSLSTDDSVTRFDSRRPSYSKARIGPTTAHIRGKKKSGSERFRVV